MPTITAWFQELPERYYSALSLHRNGYWSVFDSATRLAVPQCELLASQQEANRICVALNQAQEDFHANILHALLDAFPTLANVDLAAIPNPVQD